MTRFRSLTLAILPLLLVSCAAEPEADGPAESSAPPPAAAANGPTMSEVLEASTAADWRPLDADNTLYMELQSGRVIMELAPGFAPQHVANLRTLVAEGYFDGLFIIRSQENYVVQWGDPNVDDEGARSLGTAEASLPGEYFSDAAGHDFHPLDSRDAYADEVGVVVGD